LHLVEAGLPETYALSPTAFLKVVAMSLRGGGVSVLARQNGYTFADEAILIAAISPTVAKRDCGNQRLLRSAMNISDEIFIAERSQ
jgi:hypothetical protein